MIKCVNGANDNELRDSDIIRSDNPKQCMQFISIINNAETQFFISTLQSGNK